MAIYHWAGQNITGYFGLNIPVSELSGIENRKKVHWNNPSNWFIEMEGPTSGTGGYSYDGNFVPERWFMGASLAPGGSDTVIFKEFVYNNQHYPLSPCLYGGYWGTDGWLNAGSTSGKVNVLIEDGYGGLSSGIDFGNGPASSRIGVAFGERSLLANESYGYVFSGATMTGLRLNCNSFRNKANKNFHLGLVDLQSTIFIGKGTETKYTIDGGTCGQLFVDSEYSNSSSDSYYDTQFTFRNDVSSYTNAPANVTNYVYFGKLTSSVSRINQSNVYFASTNSVPNLVVDSPIRPSFMIIDANVDTAVIYPEERRPFLSSFGFNTVRFGSSIEPTIGSLIMKDSTEPNRVVYDASEGVSAGFSERTIIGANNIVGLNTVTSITDLQLDAGRLVLGRLDNYLSSNEYVECSLDDNDLIFIDSGFLGSKSMLNLSHPTDDTYKGVKIGAGVSHPSEGEGLQVYSENAQVTFPKDIRFVADYTTGVTGSTLDLKPDYPILGTKIR